MTMLRAVPLTLMLIASLSLVACGGGSAGTPSKNGSGTVTIDPPSNPGGGGGSDGGDDEPQDEVDEKRTLWESQGLANYDFVLQRNSFSPPPLVDPVAIQVRGGQVVSRVYVNTGLPATPPSPEWWPSIDGMFDFLRSAKDANPAKFEVTWDAQRGFPSSAFVDYVSGMTDEERGFAVSNFVSR